MAASAAVFIELQQENAIKMALPDFCKAIDAECRVTKDKNQKRWLVHFKCACSQPGSTTRVTWRYHRGGKDEPVDIWPSSVCSLVMAHHESCQHKAVPEPEFDLTRAAELQRLVPELRACLKRKTSESSSLKASLFASFCFVTIDVPAMPAGRTKR
jgi:hypothetical protein